MISIFILPLNHFWNWDAQREELTDVQREKEREKEWLTDAQREKDRVVDCDLVKHRADRDLVKCLSRSREAPHRSRSREASIAISRSTTLIAITRSVDLNLAKRRSWSREAPRQSLPLVEPSRLSLFLLLSIWPDLMIFFFFFFWDLFVFLYWGMNDIIYLFGNRENVTRFDDFFFLGFVCVSVLRNEWYYIFVWQPRKCE